MGWLDCHLHAFRARMPHKKADIVIGIPDDDSYDLEILPGWELQIADFFTEPGKFAHSEIIHLLAPARHTWEHHSILSAGGFEKLYLPPFIPTPSVNHNIGLSIRANLTGQWGRFGGIQARQLLVNTCFSPPTQNSTSPIGPYGSSCPTNPI
jgi:hypothetical protein